MMKRFKRLPEVAHAVPIGIAVRRVWALGYTQEAFRRDVMAGLVVGIVALPLSMALAIASGVPPVHGLITAVVGGAVAALAGGSRVSVTGPTAAFVVLLAPIAGRYGIGGLALASAMAGLILLGMGLGRMGQLMQFVPTTVVAGFTAGIGVVIATIQVPDALGFALPGHPEGWFERVAATVEALPQASAPDAAIAVLTLAVLIAWPRYSTRVPGPLVALGVATVVSVLAAVVSTELAVATIGSRFGEIPRGMPTFAAPWTLPGARGLPLHMGLALVRDLVPSAGAIALLGAMESLMCAVAADGLTGDQHDPDGELVGQGLANLVAPFFGGIAATGAIARTATNVRSGASSPMASVVHSAVVLVALLVLAPLLAYLPMAALAGLLLFVAWQMADVGHVVRIVRLAPRSDAAVLLTCLALTVVFDMVVAVSTGVVLASLLFMRRMAEVSDVRALGGAGADDSNIETPPGVEIYAINGPLFFGVAAKAVAALGRIGDTTRVVILDVSRVPIIDATGLVNLESAVAKLRRRGVEVVITGLQEQPKSALARAGWFDAAGSQVRFADSIPIALQPEGGNMEGEPT